MEQNLNDKIDFEPVILPKKTIFQLCSLLEDFEGDVKISNIKSKIKFELNNSVLISADYSQIELRVIASMSGDENMINAFNNNEDIHASTAAKVFNIEIGKVTKEQRSHAKIVNFGIIYGVSAFGLSNQTNLNRSESKLFRFIRIFFRKMQIFGHFWA